ncbi:Lipase_3 domain-containing protein [Meloidogyne graminicola]|uniref:Lipase_3 domain-containing protein n=1 Tax=Meloidogyne graminicola TaxID=189291 RepID=A0A8S9ZBY1_9BILA|nr:Lipase_3 domain-containing protein [Meloidogyne graminicola]
MAAAAYGDEENIRLCLNKTFKNSELYQYNEVYCNGHSSQTCSGFVAISHDDKAIILSFRGTSSFTQLILESSEIVFKTQTEWPIGGKVATYFTEIYLQLTSEGLINSVLNLIKIYSNYELWVTGHSLGGALASLAAAEICSTKLILAQKIKLITFGQPRTGDWVWAAAIDQLLPYYNYRVVNHRDVIVHLPIRYFEGYQHYRTEIWYNNGMDIDDIDDINDFIVCDDIDEDDDNCSNSLWFYKTSHHTNYFGYWMRKYGENGCLN